jgi:hypothetical protein
MHSARQRPSLTPSPPPPPHLRATDSAILPQPPKFLGTLHSRATTDPSGRRSPPPNSPSSSPLDPNTITSRYVQPCDYQRPLTSCSRGRRDRTSHSILPLTQHHHRLTRGPRDTSYSSPRSAIYDPFATPTYSDLHPQSLLFGGVGMLLRIHPRRALEEGNYSPKSPPPPCTGPSITPAHPTPYTHVPALTPLTHPTPRLTHPTHTRQTHP